MSLGLGCDVLEVGEPEEADASVELGKMCHHSQTEPFPAVWFRLTVITFTSTLVSCSR